MAMIPISEPNITVKLQEPNAQRAMYKHLQLTQASYHLGVCGSVPMALEPTD